MAVSHDSELTYSYGGGGADSRSGPTPSGTPRGVVVIICAYGVTFSGTTGVTYGGQAMSRVGSSPYIDTSSGTSDWGYVDTWFLGSGVPSGVQTVSISGSGSVTKYVTVCLVAAATAVTVIKDNGGSGGNQADPQDAMDTGSDTAIRYIGVYSGHDNIGDLTAVSSCTEIGNGGSQWDAGGGVILTQRQTTPSSGSFTVGYTATDDDCAWCSIAVGEQAQVTQTQSGTADIYGTTTRTQPGTADIYGTTTKPQPGTANIAPVGRYTANQPGTADIKSAVTQTTTGTAHIPGYLYPTQVGKAWIVPSMDNDTWYHNVTPSEVGYGVFGGTRLPQRWNKLLYDSVGKRFIFMDVYVDIGRGFLSGNIHANGMWAYYPETNTIELLKVQNWNGASGGTRILSPTIPNDDADPTPYGRHSYQAFAFSPDKNRIYLWYGANSSAEDVYGYDNDIPDFWYYDLGVDGFGQPLRTWTKIEIPSLNHIWEVCAAYDEVGHNFILQGSGAYNNSKNTYGYNVDSESWTLLRNGDSVLTPGGGGIQGGTMVYDSKRRAMWLYGVGLYSVGSTQLWKYDCAANTWSLIPITGAWPPVARQWPHLSYDSKRDRLLLVAGTLSSGTSGIPNDTWVFNPNTLTWLQITTSGTQVHDWGGQMVYNPDGDYHIKMEIYNFGIIRIGPGTYKSTINGTANINLTKTKPIQGKAYIEPNPIGGIILNESLPSGVSGLTRTNEPVTMGFPIPDSAAITSASQLGLTGPAEGQFRVLSTHRSGNAKWVLVDFLKSITADATVSDVSLVRGSGNFGGSDLGLDAGAGLFAISTGAATFSIDTDPFRGFRTVNVGGTQIVALNTTGEGIAAVVGGTRYTSANDTSPAVGTLEENGPVRCCLKVEGSLRSSGGTRLCDYTMRLHFYKGSSRVRAFLTIRNAADPASVTPAPFSFDSIEFSFPLSNTTGLTFTTKTNTGTHSASLAGGETVYAFQAYSTGKYAHSENASWTNAPISGSQNGVEVRKVGGTTYHTLGTATDYCEGWLALEDSSGRGCTLGIRHMGVMWPCSIEASGDGTVSIQPFSKRNAATGLLFAWSAHETREIFFDFHTSTPGSRDTAFYEMEYPVVGRTSIQTYNDAEAFFGETQLVTEAEQASWFTANGGTSPSLANITPAIWREHFWHTGGGDNQLDLALCNLTDWVRTGRGGFLIQGLRNSLFKADTAVVHSDGFDFFDNQVDMGEDPGYDPGAGDLNVGTFNGRTFDFEHTHWLSIITSYHLTGNEHFREAAVDFAEWKYASSDTPPEPHYFLPTYSFVNNNTGGMRVWSRYFRDFAVAYEFTGITRYLTMIQVMTDIMVDSKDADSEGVYEPCGWSSTRGYLWIAHGSTGPRTVSDFMTMQIYMEAAWEVLRYFRSIGSGRAERLEQQLQGLIDCWYNEAYLTKGAATAPGDFGFAYSYKLDSWNDPANSGEFGLESVLRPICGGRTWWLGYRLTGDTKYLDRAGKLLVGDMDAGPWTTAITPSDLAQQAMMHDAINLPTTGWYKIPIQKNIIYALGGGQYRFAFVEPAGAAEFRIRWTADGEAMRDFLYFDQTSRTYIYPPGPLANAPWFSAVIWGGVPAPVSEGYIHTVTVSGVTGAPTFASFEIRYRAGAAVVATNDKYQFGRASIYGTTTADPHLGKARVAKPTQVAQDTLGVADIKGTTTRVKSGTAAIRPIATITGNAWIVAAAPPPEEPRAPYRRRGNPRTTFTRRPIVG